MGIVQAKSQYSPEDFISQVEACWKETYSPMGALECGVYMTIPVEDCTWLTKAREDLEKGFTLQVWPLGAPRGGRGKLSDNPSMLSFWCSLTEKLVRRVVVFRAILGEGHYDGRLLACLQSSELL